MLIAIQAQEEKLWETETLIRRLTETASLTLVRIVGDPRPLSTYVAADRLRRAAAQAAGERPQSRHSLIFTESSIRRIADRVMSLVALQAPSWMWGVAGPWTAEHGNLLSNWREGEGQFFQAAVGNFFVKVGGSEYDIFTLAHRHPTRRFDSDNVEPGPAALHAFHDWNGEMTRWGLGSSLTSVGGEGTTWRSTIRYGPIPLEDHAESSTREEAQCLAAAAFLGWGDSRGSRTDWDPMARVTWVPLFSPVCQGPDLIPGLDDEPYSVTIGDIRGTGSSLEGAYQDWQAGFKQTHSAEMLDNWECFKAVALALEPLPLWPENGFLLELFGGLGEDWKVEFSWSSTAAGQCNVILWWRGRRLAVMGGASPWEATLLAFREVEALLGDTLGPRTGHCSAISEHGPHRGIPLVEIDLLSRLQTERAADDLPCSAPARSWKRHY